MEETLEQTVQAIRENYYLSFTGVQIRNPLHSFYIDASLGQNIPSNRIEFNTYIKPTNLAIIVRLKRGKNER
jgi:hypothetical protein